MQSKIPTRNDAWVRWARLIGALFIAATVLALMSGCATAPRQIVDTQGVDPARFAQDRYECEAYATQVDVGASTINGAAGGALIGAVIGGIIGGRDGALFGAKVFGVTGAAQGAGGAARDKELVVSRCLEGRGYRVLR